MSYNTYPQQTYMPQQGPAAYTNYRPMQQPQYNWNNMNSNNPQVRPVSSIEEVRACPIDFDGSVFYFPDLANKKIYTKQINLDGTATLNMYELKEIPVQREIVQIDSSKYITREEFEEALVQFKMSLDSALASKKEEVRKETQPVINF